MSGKMSKTKGSNFERKIAKDFSKWSGRTFYRTPGSGAWSSQRLGQNAQVGDIVAPEDMIFPFSVELKHHEGITLNNYMQSSGEVPEFFTQNVGDAVRSEKVPMLITHSNFAPNYLSLPYSKKFFDKFKQEGKAYMLTTITFKDYLTDEPINMDIGIVLLEDFFELYKAEDFYKGYKTLFRYWFKDMAPNIEERHTGKGDELVSILSKLGV